MLRFFFYYIHFSPLVKHLSDAVGGNMRKTSRRKADGLSRRIRGIFEKMLDKRLLLW